MKNDRRVDDLKVGFGKRELANPAFYGRVMVVRGYLDSDIIRRQFAANAF